MVFVFIGGGAVWIFLRTLFVTRTPKWIEIDFLEKKIFIEYKSYFVKSYSIDVSLLETIEWSIFPGRFPQVVVKVRFSNKEEVRKLYFQPDSENQGFFSTPREVIPLEVEELCQILQEVSLQNQGG